MVFLDFEKPLEKLYEQLEKIKQVEEEGTVDMSETIKELEKKITKEKKEIYANLTGWQRVQLSRHPERPYTLYYIEQGKKISKLNLKKSSILNLFDTKSRIKVKDYIRDNKLSLKKEYDLKKLLYFCNTI